MQKSTVQKSAVRLLGILGAVALFGQGCAAPAEPVTPVTTPPPSEPAPPVDTGTTPTTTSANYKNGTFTADGSYMTHVGPESVTITVTLKDNVITDTTFNATPNAPMSARFQDMFAQNYKPLVIGKNINDVQLGKVSGSSLTPIGFNDALAKIKAQAQI